MRTMVLLVVTAVLVSGAALASHPAHALASGGSFGFQAGMHSTNSIGTSACVRQRVCAPRGCIWRTICR